MPNPSYVTTCASPCTISYYSIDPAQKIQDQYETGNVDTALAIQAVAFSSLSTESARPYAGSSNDELTFNFEPEVVIDSDSKLILKMADTYPSIGSSSPVPECNFPYGGTCTVVGSTVEITGFDQIPAQTDLSLSLSGVTNPASTGTTPSGATGFTLTLEDDQARSVGYSELPTVTINDSLPTGTVHLDITRTLENAGVSSNYYMQIATSQGIPKGGTVQITLPSGWTGISDPQRCEISGALESFQSCTVAGGILTLTINEEVKSNEDFTITLEDVISPTISSPDANGGEQSGYFTIKTAYDGITIDETDNTDP